VSDRVENWLDKVLSRVNLKEHVQMVLCEQFPSTI
jgi:hypothetical protein